MSDGVTETESEQTGPGRPRVGITPENETSASLYLHRAFEQTDYGKEELTGTKSEARKAFIDTVGIADNAQALDNWCQVWLTDVGWQRLLAAVRQKRRRSRQNLKNVTVSQKTLYGIQRLAERDGVTQEELIRAALDAYERQESET